MTTRVDMIAMNKWSPWRFECHCNTVAMETWLPWKQLLYLLCPLLRKRGVGQCVS